MGHLQTRDAWEPPSLHDNLGWWVLPFHCFLESGAFDGGGLEDLVFMGGDGGQAQGVGDLAGGHSALYVLFIGKDHQHRLLQLVLLDRKQGALIMEFYTKLHVCIT